jgi:hypothetical protein
MQQQKEYEFGYSQLRKAYTPVSKFRLNSALE